VPLSPDAEITLEANPGTFEREKFAGYKAAGVNRLSLGIQSFDPRHLQALGRVHDEREARAAAEAALAIFGNVNFDLMYALPRQTIERPRPISPRHWRMRRRTCRSTN
jgi:oxygen-independent coproporphyrinogen-3 oxidase